MSRFPAFRHPKRNTQVSPAGRLKRPVIVAIVAFMAVSAVFAGESPLSATASTTGTSPHVVAKLGNGQQPANKTGPEAARRSRSSIGPVCSCGSPTVFRETEHGLIDSNPLNGLRARFGPGGLELHAGSQGNLSFHMNFASIGRKSMVTVAGMRPRLAGTSVRYPRPNVTEWYRNSTLGMEQGFLLTQRPSGRRSSEVAIALRTTGASRIQLLSRRQLLFHLRNGESLRYGGLRVTDAHGHLVPSRLTVDGRTVRIMIRDRDAAYPISVDPYFFANELTPPQVAEHDAFGSSTALSEDGSTAVIGSDGGMNCTPQGRAYVFNRKPGGFVRTATLSPSDGLAKDCFGLHVATNSDGSVVLVSSDQHPFTTCQLCGEGPGMVYVFSRSGSTYTQTGELTASDGQDGLHFGEFIALSADGSTALIDGQGQRAYIFSRSGSTFIQSQELTNTGGGPVGLSADGGAAVIGTYGQYTNVSIYTRSNQSYRLAATKDDSANSNTAGAVAISGDGKTVAVGTEDEAVVYSTTDLVHGSYNETAELPATDPASYGLSVSSLAIDNDGGAVLVGWGFGPQALGNEAGTVYRFDRGNSYDLDSILTAPDGQAKDGFGDAVSIDASGDTSLVGAPNHNDFGAVYTLETNTTGAATSTSVAPEGSGTPVYGDAVTFSATVQAPSAPAGSVAFWDGTPYGTNSSDLGSVPLTNGVATLTTSALGAGDHQIFVDYSGDATNAASTGEIGETVNPFPLTVTADDVQLWSGDLLQAFTFSANLKNDDTEYTFTQLPTCTTTATADPNTRRETSPPGTYPITCSGGDVTSNYTIASYQPGTLTIYANPPQRDFWSSVSAGASVGLAGQGTPVSCVNGTSHCTDIATWTDRSGHLRSTANVTDDGQNWAAYPGPSGVAWQSLSCPTVRDCLMIGYDGTNSALEPYVAATTDGGQSWTLRTPEAWNILPWVWRAGGVSCVSSTTCWVAGSTVGGLSSVPTSCKDSEGATEDCPGLNPIVWKTTDGGATWQGASDVQLVANTVTIPANLPLPPQSGPNEVVLQSISCSSANACVAVGGTDLYGYLNTTAEVLSTSDGGQAWYFSQDPILQGIDSLLDVSCPASTSTTPTCHAVGMGMDGANPIALNSTDGGATWSGSEFPGLTAVASSLSCADATDCWIGDWAGTSDGGASWHIYAPGFTLWGGPGLFSDTSCSTSKFCLASTEGYDGSEVAVTSGDGGMGTPLVMNAPTVAIPTQNPAVTESKINSGLKLVAQDRTDPTTIHLGVPVSVVVRPPSGPVSSGSTLVGTNDFFGTPISRVLGGNTKVQFSIHGKVVRSLTVKGLANAAPAITSVKPRVGPRKGGNEVIVKGLRLGKVDSVHFGTKPGKNLERVSSKEFRVWAPPNKAVQDIKVVTSDGGHSHITLADHYTYLPQKK